MPKKSFFKKTRVIEKMRSYYSQILDNGGAIGTYPRDIIFNYDNRCNFKCKHCFTNAPLPAKMKDAERITVADIKRVCDEADALGVYEIDFQGGEPMLYPNLFEMIEAADPERFHIYITSNGYLIDKAAAEKLAETGITKVTISIDGFNAEENDEFRGVKGAYERALAALGHVRDAGMQAVINYTITHDNAQDPRLDAFCRFAKSNRYQIAFNFATPSGLWHGNTGVMATPNDNAHIMALRGKYRNCLFRDLWNPTDPEQQQVCGCPSVNISYINPFGDVLPCPYIHIKIGNVKRQALKDIYAYGFSIKYFRRYNALCLSGENKEFVEKFLKYDGMSVMDPIPAREVFGPEDFI